MACAGSPTAVTGIGSAPPNSARSSTRWACPVSWYSSSSTAPNRARSPSATSGQVPARRAASDIWSAKSSAPSARLRCRYASTSGSSWVRNRCADTISVSATGSAAFCPFALGAVSTSSVNHSVYSRSRSGSTRCSPSSPASASTCAVTDGGTRSVSRSASQVATTRCASCQDAVSDSMRAPGCTGSRRPCSASNLPA